MTRKTYGLGICLWLLLESGLIAQDVTLPKVDVTAKLKDSKEVRVYPIVNGEIDVKSQTIKRIELGGKSGVVTYLNKNKKAMRPKITVRLVNAYGIEVERFSESWIFPIEAGGIHQEQIYLQSCANRKYFEFSQFKLPDDFEVAVYAVITDESRTD